MGSATPPQVVLGSIRKRDKKAMGNQLVSSIPPQHLLQCLESYIPAPILMSIKLRIIHMLGMCSMLEVYPQLFG